MDDAVDNFNVEDIQESVFKNLKRLLIKELDVDKDGNIKKTAKNLRSTQKVKSLRNVILNDSYKAKVGKYIGTFNTVKDLSNKYIKDL